MANKARSSIGILLFDWDGTLADSAPLGLAAFRKTFAELAIPFSEQIYDAAYSPNWYSIYAALGLPTERWQQADDLWNKHYGMQTARLVAGAREIISELRRRGYRLGVVSSGNESRVLREIENGGLAASFEVVVCYEHVIQKKPNPEGLEVAMRELGCGAPECGYVGDAPEDIEMGKRAGVLTIGVKSSYPSNVRLPAAQPDIYLESIRELLIHFPGVQTGLE
jgi:HAD superfamily hydrolase (TIGR01549 family)